MQAQQSPPTRALLCSAAFRIELSIIAQLMARLTRELESRRWFEPSPRRNRRRTTAIQCLATLPREQREVIVLKIWHHDTFEKSASLMKSRQHGRWRYRYGLQKTQTRLKGRL